MPSESDRRRDGGAGYHLTDELIEEGFVREIVSKIQSMRKEADFNVTDHIAVYQTGSEKIARLMTENRERNRRRRAGGRYPDRRNGRLQHGMGINGEKTTLGVKVVK